MEVRSLGTGGKQYFESQVLKQEQDVLEKDMKETNNSIENSATIVEKVADLNEKKVVNDTKNNIYDEKTKDKLNDHVEGLNKILDSSYKSLKFNVHDKLDRLFVQIVDKETDEVIREIPPEKFLDMVASMLQYAGLIVDKKV